MFYTNFLLFLFDLLSIHKVILVFLFHRRKETEYLHCKVKHYKIYVLKEV